MGEPIRLTPWEREFFELTLHEPAAHAPLLDAVGETDFASPGAQEMYRLIREQTDLGETPTFESLMLATDDLPGARDEVHALHDAVAVSPTHEGVARALARHRVVHVAGHGYTPEDAPSLGGLRLADGWFTSADVPPRVGADLVVLAACRSGTGTANAKRPVGGLPRALLAAGARQVLWTAADVDDAASARLMTAFHAARARLGTAAALGEALNLMQDQEGTPARSLPFRLTGFQP